MKQDTSNYPSGQVAVLAFRCKDDLYLTRAIEAVKGRTGEDGNYILDKEYQIAVTVGSRAHGRQYDISNCVPKRFLTDLSSVQPWGR